MYLDDNENPVAHNDSYSNGCDGEDYPCGQSSNETTLEGNYVFSS